MLDGRSMYIWHLQKSSKGGSVDDMIAMAQSAKLSSLWVKIGDGTRGFENIEGNGAKLLHDLVSSCSAVGVKVLGYHVPWCKDQQGVNDEVTFVTKTVADFNLAGIVIDNEDGPSFFKGDESTAEAYGKALQADMRAAGKPVVMSSNDILSYHKKAYTAVIGQFVDVNAPQVYYGQSPSVDSRLNWAIRENKIVKAPFFPIGAAFLRKPSDNDGGFLDPKKCGKAAAQFIRLVSLLHHADPTAYPGYGFWNWEEAPKEVWQVLETTDVFVTPEIRNVEFAASVADVFDAADNPAPSLASALTVLDKRAGCVPFTGMKVPDLNLPGNVLIVESVAEFHSFRQDGILDEEALDGQTTRVWVKKGTRAWRSSAIAIGGSAALRETLVGMEDLPAPPAIAVPGMPSEASHAHRENLLALALPKHTIAAAAAAYNGRCIGGDHYNNNCAHFLSDAFIRAGFDELEAGHSADHYITARCGTSAKRAIRARDMWQWFQLKATETATTIKRDSGMWAVFQLDERVYWGGHVVIIDTDTWSWHGTGCHWDWGQHAYKW